MLRTFRGAVHPERWGRRGDCFSVTVDRTVSLADFVLAFYTSPPFKLERWILRWLLRAPSTDADARALAQGSAQQFSVWYAGARTPTQLLMCDRYERTRSWFRVVPLHDGRTLLQFGSDLAAPPGSMRKNSMSGVRSLLFSLHTGYSHVLLCAAATRA